MIRPQDFKLGKDCNTEEKISHFDDYPEYDGKRFMKSGRSTKIFKSYIQRQFPLNYGAKLFRQYIEWYVKETGSENGIWNSWKQLCHTDFDLTHGYLWYEFLLQIPILSTTFDNVHRTSTYIGALKYAIFYDLVRYGRFSTCHETYGASRDVIFKLTEKVFKEYMKEIFDKCMAGGAMSYDNFRTLKWISVIYEWPLALNLINDIDLKRRSKSPLVRRCTNTKIKMFRRKHDDFMIPEEVEDKRVSITSVSQSIWDIVNSEE